MKSKTQSKTTIGPLITNERQLLTGGKDMSDELNTFYASVFTKKDTAIIPKAYIRGGCEVIVSEQKKLKKIRKL